ncbi:MAG: hypothetical protein HW378_4358, partial [Anaerolineales bacterium]|nr:hypothetical protein [Anaerolineales bacterium]
VNQVISKRMVKKQQMRWSDKDTPLLWQLRVKVLNDELRPMFQPWYPAWNSPRIKNSAGLTLLKYGIQSSTLMRRRRGQRA